MGKRIFWLAILLAAVLCGFYYYKHHQDEVRLANGDVTCEGCMSPEERARFQRESSAGAADGTPDRKDKASSATDASANSTTPAASPAADDTPASTPVTSTTATAPAPATPPARPPAQAAYASTNDPAFAAPPASDTIAPNPPNGMVFSGKGTYQWYRQGNLTWRVDTTSGRSCIIYATMEEWRKQIVYSHGCGHPA